MKCQNSECKSDRIVTVTAKCSDMCSVSMSGDRELYGYVPSDLGIGGGDDVHFSYCLECGQIQDDFPLDESELEMSPELDNDGMDLDDDEADE